MATYNVRYNKDDSVVRHLIIGLLADLNNKVYFYRQIDADNRVEVDVPFYYSIAGDEDFLKDNFLFLTKDGLGCRPDGAKADGNYEPVPRGIVTLQSMNVDSSKLVNKRITGHYAKLNQAGAMEGYAAEFEMIPINMSLSVEIVTSSQLDNFKITEMLIKRLYKSNYYNVEVGHLNEGNYRIACYYAMPEDYDTERPIEFSFDNKDGYKVSFTLEVNAFIPSFEFETERHVGNRMFEIHSYVTDSTPENFNRNNNLNNIDIIGPDDVD